MKRSSIAAITLWTLFVSSLAVMSVVVYLFAIPVALVKPLIACALYAVVALMGLLPDRRIEKHVHA